MSGQSKKKAHTHAVQVRGRGGQKQLRNQLLNQRGVQTDREECSLTGPLCCSTRGCRYVVPSSFMIKMGALFYCFKQHLFFLNTPNKVDLSCKMSCCPAPADGWLRRLCLISLDSRRLITAYESWRAPLRALTGVGEMNQRSEGLRIHSLHLDLLLLGLSDIASEHSCEVVRHGAQDQSAVKIHRIRKNVRDTRGMFQVFA